MDLFIWRIVKIAVGALVLLDTSTLLDPKT